MERKLFHVNSPAIIVNLKEAQIIRKILEKHGYWDRSKRLSKIGMEKIAIPITADFTMDKCDQPGLGLENKVLELRWLPLPPNKKYSLKTCLSTLVDMVRTAAEELGLEWSKDIEEDIPKVWEKHGDLILVQQDSLRCQIWRDHDYKLLKILTERLGARRVARKSRVSADDYRSPTVELILGDNGWVEHIDNAIKYTYDVTKCMFSVGNITEKLRVARLDCSGETVVDLYAGIGYFTLPYLVHAKAHKVYACEWNPHAVEALRRNLHINHVSDSCLVLQGDNRQVCPVGVADRVNLGLIPSSEPGWRTACRALRADRGGILHIHANVTSKSNSIISQIHSAGSDINHSMNMGIAEQSTHSSINNRFTKLSGAIPTGFHNNNDSKTWKLSEISKSLHSQPDLDIPGTKCDMKTVSEEPSHVFREQSNSSDLESKTDLSKPLNVKSNMENLTLESNSKCLKYQKKCKLKPEWLQWADSVGHQIKDILGEVQTSVWNTQVLHVEHVKSYAPHIDHLVLDLSCRPNSDTDRDKSEL